MPQSNYNPNDFNQRPDPITSRQREYIKILVERSCLTWADVKKVMWEEFGSVDDWLKLSKVEASQVIERLEEETS